MAQRTPPAPLRQPNGRPLHDDPELHRDGSGVALPHVYSFASIVGGASKTYWHERFDEAMRHCRENALAMRRDAYLMSLLQERKLAVASLPWYLETPNPQDERQARVRATLTQALRGTRGLRRMIWAWLEALWYGRYAVQFAWRWQRLDGRRVLAVKAWEPVNGDKIGHQWDGTPYVLCNTSLSPDLRGAVMLNTTRARAISLQGQWRDRFVIHQHEVNDADFFEAEGGEGRHGVGIRSVVYWLDFLKREYLDWVVTYLERVGLGTTFWKYDASNPKGKEQAEKAARDNSRRANIVVPMWPDGRGGYSGGVERVEAPMGGVEALRVMVEALDAYIERFVIGQAGSSQSQPSGIGNEAASEFMASTKDGIRDHDAHMLAETLTGCEMEPGLLSLMQKHSFPETMPDEPGGFPVMLRFGLEKSLNNQRVQTIQSVVQMGLPVRKDDVYNAAGLSRPEPHDDVLEPQQPGGPAGTGGSLAAIMGGGQQPGGSPVPTPEAGGDSPASEEDVDAFLAELLGGGGGEVGEEAGEDEIDGLLAELLAAAQQQFARRSRPQLYAWVRDPDYQGRNGGKWRNTATGEVRYQESEPGAGGGGKLGATDINPGRRKKLGLLKSLLNEALIAVRLRKRERKGHEEPAEAPRREVQLDDRPQRRSKAAVKFNHMRPEDAQPMLQKIFGPGATPQMLAEAIGMPDDATVYVEYQGEFKKSTNEQADLDAVGIRVTVSHPKMGHVMRFVGVDADGRRFVYNEKVEIPPKHRDGKLMLDIFGSQVEAAAGLGIDYIIADCARGVDVYGQELVGYNIWPRYGYDFPLDSPDVPTGTDARRVLDEAARLFNAKTIQDVFETREGRDWWRKNGVTLPAAIFDLRQGSLSMLKFVAYLQERKQKVREKQP